MQKMRLCDMNNSELCAYLHMHTEKAMSSFLPRCYNGPASGQRPLDYSTEPRSRIIRALKRAGYTYNRRMNWYE